MKTPAPGVITIWVALPWLSLPYTHKFVWSMLRGREEDFWKKYIRFTLYVYPNG